MCGNGPAKGPDRSGEERKVPLSLRKKKVWGEGQGVLKKTEQQGKKAKQKNPVRLGHRFTERSEHVTKGRKKNLV